MENQNSKIDEIFRQRLHDAEVPPPPFVWPAVEQGLQKRRRRVLVAWLFAFGALAGSAGLLWQSGLWNDAQPGLTKAPAIELPGNTAYTANSDEAISPDPNLSADSKATETSESNASNVLKVADASPTGSGEKAHSNDVPATRAKSSAKGLSLNSVNETKILQSPVDQKITTPDFTFPVNHANENLQILPADKPLIAQIPLALQASEPVVSMAGQKRDFAPKTFKPHSRRKKSEPKLCYDFARHPRAWLIDVYAGPSLAQRSLTSRLDDVPYLNQRLATESRSSAMNAGVRASLMFNRNLLVRTGLHYTQLTEEFEYIDPTSVIYLLKFNPGNPVPDTLGVQYGENYLKTYNRYQALDIPLMIGLEMRHGRSGFNINAGLSANLLFQQRGVIIDPLTHEPARIGPIPEDPKAVGPKTSVSQEVFRTNLGLSATASIQWYWHVKPHFRLFVEPAFRQVLRPVTLNSHPVEQRYSFIELRLGATKIF